jgi:beta-lactamase class A
MRNTDPRRRVVVAALALLCLAGAAAIAVSVETLTKPSSSARASTEPDALRSERATPAGAEVRSRFSALERRRDARLGVMAIDTGSGETLGYRSDERFALASTVKVPLAAAVLDRLSADDLERRLFWTEADLIAHSPVTELFVEDGMTVRQLIDAALTLSDNTATNLLFDLVGGPGAVDDRLAELGDPVTSVDRVEPELNDWRPGEVRDTSTPRALAAVVRDLTLGDFLGRDDRRLLDDELGDSLTGARLVRAGVPDGWRVGDKSGTASYGTRNNVAVVYPPGRAPWVVVVMTSHDEADAETDDTLVARAAQVVVEHWS